MSRIKAEVLNENDIGREIEEHLKTHIVGGKFTLPTTCHECVRLAQEFKEQYWNSLYEKEGLTEYVKNLESKGE